jgi:ElaB/YqjD/DUF883 family membrane-anchored ribosome-binding protein
MGEEQGAIEERIEERREHMGDTVSALAYKADVPSRVKGSVSEKTQAMGGKLGDAKRAIAGTSQDAIHSTEHGARRTVGMAQENPLGLAIGAAAIGFVVGSLLPATRVEKEKVGPLASEVRSQASDLASEAVEHGKDVAHDTMQAARETAVQSGQEHAGELRDSAQEHVSQQ